MKKDKTVHYLVVTKLETACHRVWPRLDVGENTFFSKEVTCPKCIANIIAEKLLKG
jgi:hypothetical protein